MKTCINRLLCLTLVLALALSLGGCGKMDGFLGAADLLVSAADMPSPENDPAGFLRLNAVNTIEAVKARYAGSPLAALAGIRADAGVLTLTWGETRERLTAALTFDRTAGRIGVEAAGGGLHARLYADPDFFGVSLPEIAGGTYYGFAPADVYSRASNSALGGLMGEDVLTALKELESLLDAARSASPPDPKEAEKRLENAFEELFSASQVNVERSAIQYGDQKTDGYILTVDAAGAAVSAFQQALREIFPALTAGPSENSADAPAGCRTVFAANGFLVSATLEFTGGDGSRWGLALELFTENGETLTLTRSGETVTLMSRPVPGENGWSHTLTLQKGGQTSVLTTAYEKDNVALSLAAPEKSLRVSGELHVTEDGFTLDNASVASGRPASVRPLTASFAASGPVEKPTDTVDIFSLDEAALSSLLIRAYKAMEKEGI